jgi:hypothetical protein
MSHETTYALLTAKIQEWLEDDDAEFTASIDDVILLAELRCLKDLDLTLFSVDGTTATAIGNVAIAKPSVTESVVSWQTIYYDVGSERTFLQLRSNDWIRDYQTPGSTASPLFYCEDSEAQWLVAPIPDAVLTIEARGIARPEGLSGTNTTSWLGDNVPDLLFKACLAEAEGFLKSDDRIDIWTQQYIDLLPIVKRETYEMLNDHYHLTPLEMPAAPLNRTQQRQG